MEPYTMLTSVNQISQNIMFQECMEVAKLKLMKVSSVDKVKTMDSQLETELITGTILVESIAKALTTGMTSEESIAKATEQTTGTTSAENIATETAQTT